MRSFVVALLVLLSHQSYAVEEDASSVCFLTTKQLNKIGFKTPADEKLFSHCEKGDVLLLEGGNIRFKNYLAAVARLCEFETIKLEFPDTNEYAAMCIFSGKVAPIKEP